MICLKETDKVDVGQRQQHRHSVPSSSSTSIFNYEPSQILNSYGKLSSINEEEVSVMKLIQSRNRGLLPFESSDDPSVRKQHSVL